MSGDLEEETRPIAAIISICELTETSTALSGKKFSPKQHAPIGEEPDTRETSEEFPVMWG